MSAGLKGAGTVGKALETLDLVAAQGHPVRFTDLLDQSPYPKATLYRLLQTLTNQGMLGYDKDRQTYSLGLRLVRLAHAAWRSSALAPIARPFIDQLAAEVGETVHLAQLDNGQVLYVDKRNAARPVEMFSQAGKVGPAYCTGVGKAIMAFLDPGPQARALAQQSYLRYTPTTLDSAELLKAELATIRAEGVSFDREEHEPHIICIAAPIFSGGPDGTATTAGKVIGGLSITSTTPRHSLRDMEKFRPALLDCAANIGAAAADWQFPTQT